MCDLNLTHKDRWLEAQRFADGNRDSFSCTDFVNRFGYSAVDGIHYICYFDHDILLLLILMIITVLYGGVKININFM